MKKRWPAWLAVMALILLLIGCGAFDSDDDDDQNNVDPEAQQIRPVLFIHGSAGSASQFESQAQRFMANGYPLDHLAVFEYSTNIESVYDIIDAAAELNAGINAKIDELLAASDADQVDLIGHSLGTLVSYFFLDVPENAERVAHYVNVDGWAGRDTDTAPPGGVQTLALWGMQNPDQNIPGAQNSHDAEQSHIQRCTSDISFGEMYQFFNGEAPVTTLIPEAEGDNVTIAGKVNIFPDNAGANGTTLTIYEVDPDTGFRLSEDEVDSFAIGNDGSWGPVTVDKGASYEFHLADDTVADAQQHFYREPFWADDYFIRFNTSRPNEGLSSYLPRSANHTNLMIARDKEIWGDQVGDENDELLVDGTNVATPEAAAQNNRLSALFLFDCGPDEVGDEGYPDPNSDGISDLSAPNTYFHSITFMSGLDLYIPAATPPDSTIEVELTPRGGGGSTQVINVPNWPSDEVRTVVVQFRDFVQ